MTDYTDTDTKLEEYSEIFDYYMEHGEMPPTASNDDCLIGYIQEVIDSNPQIDTSDSTWGRSFERRFDLLPGVIA